jgi:hypothetical protein
MCFLIAPCRDVTKVLLISIGKSLCYVPLFPVSIVYIKTIVLQE